MISHELGMICAGSASLVSAAEAMRTWQIRIVTRTMSNRNMVPEDTPDYLMS